MATEMRELLTYGEGGFDPGAPDGNVVERQWVEVEIEDEPGTLDQDTVAAIKAQLAKATTVAGVKSALGPLLDALG